jgi:hypothetical protein
MHDSILPRSRKQRKCFSERDDLSQSCDEYKYINEQRTKEIPFHKKKKKKNAFFWYNIKEIIKKHSSLFDIVHLFELSGYTGNGVLCLWKGRRNVSLLG